MIVSSTEFVLINNTLDREHRVIFDALDKLYDACEKHWHTEERMNRDGNAKQPADHPDTTAEWDVHQQEHTQLLADIKAMKQRIITHIETRDVHGFHWA